MSKLRFPPRAMAARFAGIAADNAFLGNTSASRSLMSSRQREQSISLTNPQPCCAQNGMERDLHHHTYKIDIPVDAEILDVIPITATDPWRRFIFYRDTHTHMVSHVETTKAYSGDGKYGFVYRETAHSHLRRGDHVEAGTVLYEPPASQNESEYNFGIELMTAICSKPETAEDGIQLCEDAIPRFGFSLVERRRILVKEWYEPIIVTEQDGVQYVVPEPGMTVRDDGILMALRNLQVPMAHTMYSKHSLQHIDHDTDILPQLHHGGGTVVDIHVTKSRHPTHTHHTSQLDDLARICMEYDRNILAAYRHIARANTKFSDETRSYITRLLLTTEYAHRSKGPTSLNINLETIPPYVIDITIATPAVPDIGSKLTDRFSAKGVTVSICSREEMPVDQYGRRADIVVAREAGTNRNIVGRDHLQLVSDCIYVGTEMVLQVAGKTRVMESYGQAKQLARKLWGDHDKRKAITDIVRELYYHINKAQLVTFDKYYNDVDEMHVLLTDILTRGIIVGLPLDVVAAGNQKENDHPLPLGPIPIINALKQSRFYRPPGPVTYRTPDNELVTTINSIRIAPIYYSLLDKLAFTCSATNSMGQQVRGLAALSGKDDKETQPLSRSNVKIMGNDECIVAAGVIGPVAMAKFIRDLQSAHHNAVYTTRVLNTGECYPDISVDDSPVTTSRGSRMIHHAMNAAGIELHWKKD